MLRFHTKVLMIDNFWRNRTNWLVGYEYSAVERFSGLCTWALIHDGLYLFFHGIFSNIIDVAFRVMMENSWYYV